MCGVLFYGSVNNAITFLKGKRTYFVVALGLIYVGGAFLGFWELDEEFLISIGLGGLWFLRAAMPKNTTPLLMVACLAFGAVGCKTPNAEGRALVSVAITVDHAMEGWATYVAAGQASESDEAKVKGAYERYQLAMKAAQGAYLAYEGTKDASGWERASAVLKAAQADLLTLIESFGAKSQ